MRSESGPVTTESPDDEFVASLRAATERYLQAVDDWESAYAKYYRLPTPSHVSSDLEPYQRTYLERRRALQKCMPRARRMCMKLGLRDPWQSLIRIELGAVAPQAGAVSAIGRGERLVVQQCLAAMEEAARRRGEMRENASGQPRGILRRIYDLFF